MKEQLNKVKTHFQEHKEAYIGTTIGVAGLVGGMLVARNGIQIVDSGKLVHIQWKSPNNIVVEMIRPGRKSFVLQCKETQQTWPSLRAAAKDLGLNPGELSKHLKGEIQDVHGNHFEKLAEI